MVDLTTKKPERAATVYKEVFSYPGLEELYVDYIANSKATGRDGTRQEQFEQNLQQEMGIILKKTRTAKYSFTRYKPRLASKGPEKTPRVLSIPTIRDRLTLRAVNNILARIFPEARTQLPHTYIKSIRSSLKNYNSTDCFIRIDLTSFYQTINHDILMRKVRQRIRKPQLLHLIYSAITTPTYHKQPQLRGVPEGLSISNILASILLLDFDRKLSGKYTFFRYVDDILVIAPAKDAYKIYNEVIRDIKKLDLNAHELGSNGKTEIKEIQQGIDYLGFHITDTRIAVRETSFGRMVQNLLKVFTVYKYRKSDNRSEQMLLWRLNLKITGCIYKGKRFGWVFFFSQITDKRQLGRLDDLVENELLKRSLSHLSNDVKTFIRAFHEIRFNLSKTNYIPVFDELSNDEMINALVEAQGHDKSFYERMTSEELNKHFSKFMDRQTRELEEDLIGVTY